METFLNAFRDAYGALARCRARWDDAQGASVALLGTAVNAFERLPAIHDAARARAVDGSEILIDDAFASRVVEAQYAALDRVFARLREECARFDALDARARTREDGCVDADEKSETAAETRGRGTEWTATVDRGLRVRAGRGVEDAQGRVRVEAGNRKARVDVRRRGGVEDAVAVVLGAAEFGPGRVEVDRGSRAGEERGGGHARVTAP